jgi:hypothetical protein
MIRIDRWNWLWGLALVAGTASAASNEVVVDGMRVEFGVVAAEQLRGYPSGSVESAMHGGVPKGTGYYHANVSLFDAATRAPIADARVEAEMAQAGTDAVKKTLEPMTINGAVSYGNYFRVMARTPYEFTIRIRKAGASHVTEAKFRPQPD